MKRAQLVSRGALLVALTFASRATLAQQATAATDPSTAVAPVPSTNPDAAAPRAEDPTPVPPPGPTVATKYVVVASLAAGSAVAFLVSALFDSAAGSAYDDATELAHAGACGTGPSCSAFDDKKNDASRDRVVSGVVAGVGGLVLAGAIGTWFFWPEDDKEETPSGPGKSNSPTGWLAPAMGPRGASLEAGVRF